MGTYSRGSFALALAIGGAFGLMLALSSCDLAKDTASTTEGGTEGATGIAEKMSGGTLEGADEDTGE